MSSGFIFFDFNFNKHIHAYTNFAAQVPETGNGTTETGKWGNEI